jgi:heme A synthase
MSLDELESLGVTSKSVLSRPDKAAVERMEKAKQHSGLAQMESEQKIWRWVLVAMLIVLLIEIWLAGWTSAKSLDPARDGSVEPQTGATAVSHGERK